MFRVLSMFLWGAVGILTARTLSVEDRGTYAAAIVLSAAVGGISSFTAATGYFVANRKRQPAEVAANGLLMSAPIGLVLLLAAFATAPIIGGEDARILPLAALAMFPSMMRNTMVGVLLGSNQIVRYNIAINVPVLLAFAFLGVWVGILGNRTAEDALIAWCVAQYVSLLPVLAWGKHWLAWMASHKPDRELMRGMVRFSVAIGAGGIIGFLNYRLGLLLVRELDSKEGAGIYSSALAVAEALWLFSSAIALASYARIGSGDRREAAQVTATGVRHTVLVVMIGGLSAALIAPTLVELLFGSPYREASAPLRILCIGTALAAPNGLLTNYFVQQLGRPALQLMLGCISLVLNVILGLLFIPEYGTVGAAWATTISYGVSMSIAILLFCTLSGTPFSELWRIRKSDIVSYFRLARDVLNGSALRGVKRTEPQA